MPIFPLLLLCATHAIHTHACLPCAHAQASPHTLLHASACSPQTLRSPERTQAFPEENSAVQLQLVTAAVKLFLKSPQPRAQQMIQLVLTYATQVRALPSFILSHAHMPCRGAEVFTLWWTHHQPRFIHSALEHVMVCNVPLSHYAVLPLHSNPRQLRLEGWMLDLAPAMARCRRRTTQTCVTAPMSTGACCPATRRPRARSCSPRSPSSARPGP